MQKKYHRPPRKTFPKKTYTSKIKPGTDAKLNKVFARIGVPEKKPFKPDRFQLDALAAIETADCLVTVPTGSGKTWIAEQAIARNREQGGKTWYASPLKALSNSIYAHFREIFGSEQVGILTGDRKENPDAPIIVGTTEILRNQLYDAMYEGKDLATDFVILDEAHYLGDEERGVVWEEVMIYLPSRIPLLMLSATIGNAGQIAGWLESIRTRKCIIIEHGKRPVPLYPLFFHPSGTLFPLLAKAGPQRKKVLYKKVFQYLTSRHQPVLAPPRKLPPMGKILRVLKKYHLLPAIFFLKSRADCDGAIELCTEELLHQDPERKLKLARRIDELLTPHHHLAKHQQLWNLEHLGVGSHHSGQLPIWKEIVETLMAEGLLDAVFATSTVAAGVNFPARTVVLFNSDRYNGTEFLPLDSTQFHQMTGRAGRRGKDNIGFAVTIPGKFMDLRQVAKLVDAPPTEVLSQIRINFSMVLNLLLSHTPEQIRELLNKSFASYLIKEKKKRQKDAQSLAR
jgi:superfamily II RNA helicase